MNQLRLSQQFKNMQKFKRYFSSFAGLGSDTLLFLERREAPTPVKYNSKIKTIAKTIWMKNFER